MRWTFAILFSLFLITSSLCYSQGFKLGIQAGYDLTDIRNSDVEEVIDFDYKAMSFYNFNLFLMYQGKGRLGISLEPGYIKKGANATLIYAGTKIEDFAKLKMDYIDLPLLLNIRLIKKLSLGIGAQGSFLLKATEEYTGGYTQDVTDDLENIDMAAVAGIDYNLFDFLDIALRYSFGFTPITDITFTDNTGVEVGQMKLYNQVLQFDVRFNILRGKKEENVPK